MRSVDVFQEALHGSQSSIGDASIWCIYWLSSTSKRITSFAVVLGSHRLCMKLRTAYCVVTEFSCLVKRPPRLPGGAAVSTVLWERKVDQILLTVVLEWPSNRAILSVTASFRGIPAIHTYLGLKSENIKPFLYCKLFVAMGLDWRNDSGSVFGFAVRYLPLPPSRRPMLCRQLKLLLIEPSMLYMATPGCRRKPDPFSNLIYIIHSQV